jgi:medium-chain acyl-[acyl-carrier-protein] hydrolase
LDVVRGVLGLSASQAVDENKGFFDMGLDSLMAVELKNRLQQGIGKVAILATTAVFDHPSVLQMSDYLLDVLHIQPGAKRTSTQRASLAETLASPRWLVHQKTVSNSKVRLFCFHHAGGNANAFQSWQQHMGEGIEVIAIELPGRALRYNEQLLSDVKLVVDGIVHAMLPYLDKPYVIFAHSLGTMVASEVIKSMQQMNLPQPLHIVFSSCTPFYLNVSKLKLGVKNLSDNELIDFVANTFDGIPEQFLKDRTLLEPLVPILRADLMLEEGAFENKEPFATDITTIYCTGDKAFSEEDVKLWAKMTSKSYHHYSLPGGHLAILDNPLPFIEIINSTIKGLDVSI